MRRHGLIAAFTVVAALVAGQAFAQPLFYLSESNPGDGTNAAGNPDITLNVGETTTVTLWAETDGTSIIGVDLDILNSILGVASAVPGSLVLYNPGPLPVIGNKRWNDGSVAGVEGQLLTGTLLAAIGGPNGIGSGGADFFDPTIENGAYPILSFDIQGDAVGATDVFMTISGGGMAYAGVDGAETFINFGTGDNAIAAVGSVNPNGQSAVADATITVIPEPASLSLLALGALALVRRR